MVNDTTTTTTATPVTTDTTTANGNTPRRSSFSQPKPKVLRPFNTAEVKVLLLENVNETAVKAFKKQGYQVKNNNKHLEFFSLLVKQCTLSLFIIFLSLFRSRPMLKPLSVMS